MQVRYIQTAEQFNEVLPELKQIPKMCLDCETTGLQATIAKLRLLQLCDATPEIDDRIVYVLDLFKFKPNEDLKELIESRAMLLAHNMNFDFQFLLSIGIDFKNKIFDTYVAERVLRSGFKEKRISPKSQNAYFTDVSCSLKAVAERRLEIEISKEQQRSDWGADELDIEQIEYAAKDVDILPRIAALQLAELKEESLLSLYGLESRCVRPVAMMSYKGFCIDLEKLNKLKVSIEEELKQKTEQFVKSLDDRLPADMKLPRGIDGKVAVGKRPKKDFNPGSTTQVISTFTACGIELPRDAKTEKKTLNQIALAEFNSDDPTLNFYRQRVKAETKLEHITKLLENVNPVTLRMHSGYNQTGANSGRFTSNGAPKTAKREKKTVFAVNIQQVPRGKEFRECFIAESGFKLVICDWAQIELRLGAELINIPQMRQAFKDDIDLHTMTASLIYRKNLHEVSKDERQDGKTLNFALLYGMGYRKYKTYAAQSGKMISLSEAKVAHAAFHAAYPRLRMWHRERAALVEDGWAYVRTACGRRRLLSYDDATMMCSANTLIQGSGADILKIAVADLNEHLNENVRMVACIHDEIVLEVREDLATKYKEVLETAMIQAAQKVLSSVPASADANVGDSWAAK